MRPFAILIAIALLARPVRAEDPIAPANTVADEPAFREFRVSALIQGAQGFLVGFVDATSGQSFYIPEHGTARGINVVNVDYEAERIELNLGTERRELYLTDAPESRTVKAPAVGGDAPYLDDLEPYPENETNPTPAIAQGPSEGLKAMMAQFPEAVTTNFLSQPNAIQQLAVQHPEWAERLQPTADRHGPGIEAMMKLYPNQATGSDVPGSDHDAH